MRKNQFARKTITGSVACALLLGTFAGGVYSQRAYAAETVGTSPIVSQHLNSIVRDTAWLADKNETVIFEGLKQGKSLADASGLSASELTNKLNGLLVEDINHLYEDSDVSSSEIDSVKSEGEQAIASAVTEKGFAPAGAVHAVDLNAIIQNQLQLAVSNAAAFSSEESSDIEQRVQAGQPLYQAAGLSQSELTSKLVAQLNQAIDNATSAQHIAPSVVQAAKEEGARLLAELVETGRVNAATADEGSTSSVTSAVYARLDKIVVDATIIADKDYIDVTDVLAGGGTLVQATGLSEASLYSKLTALMNGDIEQAAVQAHLSGEQIDQAKAEAAQTIQTILTTPGYNAQSSNTAETFKAELQGQLNLVVSEAATMADRDLYDVEAALQQGASLASATGMNALDLSQRLLTFVNQFIDAHSVGLDNETLNQAKQDAASYISQLVQQGLTEE